jgi:hypothetical protein
MKQFRIVIFTLVLVLFCLFSVAGCTVKKNPVLAYSLIEEGTAYEVSKGEAVEEIVIIPESYNGKPVTRIAKYAFSYSRGLKSITIPDGVKSIGENAFSDCQALIDIIIPYSVNRIGRDAFSRTAWYEEQPYDLVYAGKVLYDKKGSTSQDLVVNNMRPDTIAIADYALENCSELIGIIIPASVAYIGEFIFAYSHRLQSIKVEANNPVYRSENDCLIDRRNNILIYACNNSTIPVGIEGIGDSAFDSCFRLSSLIIPDGVKSIGKWAFSGCYGFDEISIPDTVTSIGEGAFQGCSGIKSITIPQGVTKIEASTFKECGGLVSINLSPNLTSIGDFAFFFCEGLTSITFPESLESIGELAFENCSSLTSINLPKSLKSLGPFVFSYCDAVTSIQVVADNPVYRSENNCLIERRGNVLLLGCKTSTIPNSVENIGDHAFAERKDLKNIFIPESVIGIGPFAFSGSGLSTITIPRSVTSIGEAAFYGCSELSSITIPDGVNSIGERAFSYCPQLMSIIIPKSVENISGRAFADWSNSQVIYIKGRQQAPSTWQANWIEDCHATIIWNQ